MNAFSTPPSVDSIQTHIRWQTDTGILESAPGANRHGYLDLPISYDDPNKGFVSMAVAIWGEHKERTLIIGPGDCIGSSGLKIADKLARALSPEIREHFKIIGFDHRFVGHSGSLSTDIPMDQGHWLFSYYEDHYARDDLLGQLADSMWNDAGDLIPHLSMRNICFDIELLRRALGIDMFSYLGYNYWALLGSVYKRHFPQNIDCQVADSTTSPTSTGRTLLTNIAPAYELALGRFTDWCAERSSAFGIGRTASEVQTTVQSCLRRSGRLELDMYGVPIDRPTLTELLIDGLGSESRYPAIADLIHALRTNDLVGGAALETVSNTIHSSPEPSGIAAKLALLRNSGHWPRDIEIYRSESALMAGQFPLIGEAAYALQIPALWPPQEPIRKYPRTDMSSTLPSLIVHTERGIPPISGAEDLLASLGRYGRLVVCDDVSEGRTFPFLGWAVLDQVVTDYLLNRVVPSRQISHIARTQDEMTPKDVDVVYYRNV